jgi:hypothetical protein
MKEREKRKAKNRIYKCEYRGNEERKMKRRTSGKRDGSLLTLMSSKAVKLWQNAGKRSSPGHVAEKGGHVGLQRFFNMKLQRFDENSAKIQQYQHTTLSHQPEKETETNATTTTGYFQPPTPPKGLVAS